jgi:hypothetical protein
VATSSFGLGEIVEERPLLHGVHHHVAGLLHEADRRLPQPHADLVLHHVHGEAAIAG